MDREDCDKLKKMIEEIINISKEISIIKSTLDSFNKHGGTVRLCANVENGKFETVLSEIEAEVALREILMTRCKCITDCKDKIDKTIYKIIEEE